MGCQVRDLFDIEYGQSLALNALSQTTSEDGGVAFVSRTAKNNGVSAWVDPISNLRGRAVPGRTADSLPPIAELHSLHLCSSSAFLLRISHLCSQAERAYGPTGKVVVGTVYKRKPVPL